MGDEIKGGPHGYSFPLCVICDLNLGSGRNPDRWSGVILCKILIFRKILILLDSDSDFS